MAGFTLTEIKRLIKLRLTLRGMCEEVAVFFDSKLMQLARQGAEIKLIEARQRPLAVRKYVDKTNPPPLGPLHGSEEPAGKTLKPVTPPKGARWNVRGR